MFKKTILILGLLTGFLFSQSFKLWDESVSSADSGVVDTDYSKEFIKTVSFFKSWKEFNGLYGVTLVVDSASTRVGASPDTLQFYPEYLIGKDSWVRGAVITWSQVATTSADTGYIATTSSIYSVAHSGNIYVWQTDPTDETELQGYPIIGFRMYRAALYDSVGFDIKCYLNSY